MATVKKKLRQVRALNRFTVRVFKPKSTTQEQLKIHERYVERKEVERQSLTRSTNGLSLNHLMNQVTQ